MNTKSRQSGYVGLLALLFGVAVLMLFYSRFYLSPISNPEMSSVQPITASGTLPATRIEAMHADIDAAEALKADLNRHSDSINAILEE